MWASLAWSLTGYIAGGTMFSWLLPKWLKGVDTKESSEDGNPGMYNAAKYAGLPIGLCCLALDMAKGYLPVLLARPFVPPESYWFLPVLLAQVAGHAFSWMFHGHGGKGIATSFGVLLALLPYRTVFVLAAFYVLFAAASFVKPNELKTVLAFALTALVQALLPDPMPLRVAVLLLSALVVFQNRREAFAGVREALQSIHF